MGRLLATGDFGGAAPIAAFSYIGRTRVAERTYPLPNIQLTYLNSGLTNIGYDGLRRTVQLRYLSGNSNQLLVGCDYTYNRRNKPITELKLHALNDSQLYGFDSFNRLLHFARGTLDGSGSAIISPSSDAPSQSNWTLDGASNWRQVDNETRKYNSLNELVQRSNTVATAIQWDLNGNQTDSGIFNFQFDYQSRLRKVIRKSDGLLVATYAYDAGGRRISKVVTNSGALNGTTFYYLKGLRRIEERDGNDVLKAQYVYGRSVREPLVMDRNLDGDDSAIGPGDQRLFYLQNRVQSVYGLANVFGQLVEGYEYGAYGQQTVYGPDTNGVVDFGTRHYRPRRKQLRWQ